MYFAPRAARTLVGMFIRAYVWTAHDVIGEVILRVRHLFFSVAGFKHTFKHVQLLDMSAGRRQPLQDVVNHCWTSSRFFLLCFEG